MIKRVVVIAAAIALLLPIGLAGVRFWNQAMPPAMAQTSTQEVSYNPAQMIKVVGQGSVRIKPDIARTSIGVETLAETVKEAVQQNESQMKAILTALKASGIAEKDIQTTNYSIYFERPPEIPFAAEPSTEKTKLQYRVSNMVNVTIRDLEKVDDVLDAVIEAGANNIWGVSFSLEDSKNAQADARAKAIADAQERAKALAELSGVTLGPVMSVSEVIGGGAVPVPVAVVERAAVAGGGPISPGELEITYQVEVSYFINP